MKASWKLLHCTGLGMPITLSRSTLGAMSARSACEHVNLGMADYMVRASPLKPGQMSSRTASDKCMVNRTAASTDVPSVLVLSYLAKWPLESKAIWHLIRSELDRLPVRSPPPTSFRGTSTRPYSNAVRTGRAAPRTHIYVHYQARGHIDGTAFRPTQELSYCNPTGAVPESHELPVWDVWCL